MKNDMKVVRDPVHNYVSFSEEERKLIDSPWFQRLRHCAQNGPTRLVYPSILGTRFEHSIGVMDLASRLLNSALDSKKYHEDNNVVKEFISLCARDLELFFGRKKTNVTEDISKIIRITALCHDIGHFPLSHTLEQAFKHELMCFSIPLHEPRRACHELVSVEMVRCILESKEDLFEEWVGRAVILVMLAPSTLSINYKRKTLSCSQTMFNTLNGIIMGDYDADRLDYLQRDGYLSGSGFGRVDVQRFVDSMMLIKSNSIYSSIPSSKALSTVEACLIERYKLFKWVYLHHKVLFFDEVCCEMARTLFRKKEIIKELFCKYDGKISEPKTYYDKILRSLANPSQKIPPLLLFDGQKIGLGKGYYKLNPDFFIHNKETHFFDDVWFSQKARNKIYFPSHSKFYINAVIDRKQCGFTLWKDWSQFVSFHEMCITTAQNSTKLKDIISKKNFGQGFGSYIPNWLNNLFTYMREGVFPETVFSKMIGYLKVDFKKEQFNSIRPLFRVSDWRFFGDLKSKQIVGRPGTPDNLIKHSALLSELSNLTGEIPFFAFIAGETAVIENIKNNSIKTDQLLTIVAESFIKSLAYIWDQKVDNKSRILIEAAWREATIAIENHGRK